jgi:ribosomal-protein-alanine N-acetyltransferase
MKQMKRISIEKAPELFARAQRGLLRSVDLTQARLEELERSHPDYIVTEGDALLIADPRGPQIDLHYAFPDRDAFARQFPEMFRRVAVAVTSDDGALGYLLKLRSSGDRPYVEPVLRAQWFEIAREWLRMTIAGLPETSPNDDVAPGFVLRPVRPDDAEAILDIDRAAFAMPWLTPQQARGEAGGQTLRVLEQRVPRRVVGYLRLRESVPGEGYISDVAVHPAYQRRGLGEALLRWALASFRAQGLERAALTVSTDNGGAIALYRKLGFVTAETGLDYRRPVDEEEVRQSIERRQGHHIKVRRR